LPEAARLVTYRLRFIPDAVAAGAIAGEVGDDPDDLDTWDATLRRWATATRTGGGAYHRGPNALPALLERFRDNRRTRRDRLDAVMRKASGGAAETGDVPKAPEGVIKVSRVGDLVDAPALAPSPSGSGVPVSPPDAPVPGHPRWFAAWMDGMTARADDAPSRGLMAAAKPVTGEVGPGDRVVVVSVPSITLRWWRARRIDVLAVSVAEGLGLILRIGSPGAGGPGPSRADFTDANLTGAFRRPGISRADMDGVKGLDTVKGLVK